jgi:NADH-quinone oxidoreductase subunit L
MPVTFWTFLVGTLALAGVWPLSGFFSKDSILALAAERNFILFLLGVAVAFLTTFYMFRLVFVVFFGATKSESAGHAHESPPVMVWPLRILAVFSVIGGLIGLAQIYGTQLSTEAVETGIFGPFIHAPLASVAGLLAVAAGVAAAYLLYSKAAKDPLPERLGALSRAMRNRFYFDELYEAVFIRAHDLLAAIATFFDRWIITGLAVRGTHGTTELIGRMLRQFQTGNLQTYAFLFALGVAFLLYLALR